MVRTLDVPPRSDSMPTGAKIIISGIATAIIGGLLILFSPFYTVSEYERVVVTRFGQFEAVSGPGLHWYLPIVNGLEAYPVNIQSFHATKINTYTDDNQELDAQITVVYQLPENNIQRIYTSVRDYKPRMESLAIDRFKRVMGKVKVEQVAAQRGTVASAVHELVKADASRLFGIDVVDLQINDLEFTKTYRAAIDAAATAKARVEQAEQERRQSEVDAQRQKIRAEGEANAARETARGRADGELLVATAQAKGRELIGLAEAAALKAQGEAMKASQGLVAMEMAKKWSGNLPVNLYGSAPIPFLQMMTEEKR